MPGIRIHHRERRATVIDVPHMGRMTATGPKLYKVALDHEGDALVSETVWARLQEAYGLLGYCPFLVMNGVREPPAQLVSPTFFRATRIYA